jgi:hypothetical protein
MDAVEVSNAYDRAPEVQGNLAEIAEDMHGQISKGIRNPS